MHRRGSRPGIRKPKINRFQIAKVVDGMFAPPSEEELAAFEAEFPQYADKWASSRSLPWPAQAKRIIDKLCTKKEAYWFLAPVDPEKLNLPEYFKVITHPMDLGTVKNYLAGSKYTTPSEFAADVRLTFNNAMTFNGVASPVYACAKKLLQMFEKALSDLAVTDGDGAAPPPPPAAPPAALAPPPAALGGGAPPAAAPPAPAAAPPVRAPPPAAAPPAPAAPAHDWASSFGGAAAGGAAKPELSDSDDDDDAPAAAAAAGGGGATLGLSIPSSACFDDGDGGAEGGKHPPTGGKGPAAERPSEGGKGPGGDSEGGKRPTEGGKGPPQGQSSGAEDDSGVELESTASVEDYVSESDLFGEEGDGEEASDLDNSEMGDNASEMGEETGMESEMGENGADAYVNAYDQDDDDDDDDGFGDEGME